MNEKGVVMSEFTWSGRSEVGNPQGMMVIAMYRLSVQMFLRLTSLYS